MIAGLPEVLVETTQQPSHQTIYVYGLGRLAQFQDDAFEWFLDDALGSVRQVAAGDGSILLAQEYDPYGQRLDAAGSGSSGYGYAGEQWDGYTQFIFLRARWYDPRSGRFVSQDPIGYAAGDINLYRYVLNNPIKYRDSSGHQGCEGRPGEPCHSVPFKTSETWPSFLYKRSTCWMYIGMHKCTGYNTPKESDYSECGETTACVVITVPDNRPGSGGSKVSVKLPPDLWSILVDPHIKPGHAILDLNNDLYKSGKPAILYAVAKTEAEWEVTGKVWTAFSGAAVPLWTVAINPKESAHLARYDLIYLPLADRQFQVGDYGTGDRGRLDNDVPHWIDIYLGEGKEARQTADAATLTGINVNYKEHPVYKAVSDLYCFYPCPSYFPQMEGPF
ncbi:MAG: RHS repeat-associated core domain-containing protein [Anaerolineae bacterium]|nr:RHS repeat-associated core domain-containing protein [Anaerolineae bacterium]